MDFAPGSECPKCHDGAIQAYSSHLNPSGSARIRYYRCSMCGWRPDNNKMVIPAQFAPRRIKMRKPSTKFGNRAYKQKRFWL